MAIPPLPPGHLRYPSYDPVIRFGPERDILGRVRRLYVTGEPLGPIEVKYRHGLTGERVRILTPAEAGSALLQGFTTARTTPPLRPEGAMLATAGPVVGWCSPAVAPLPSKMPEQEKGST